MAAIPSNIGKYELVRRLGQGGMGSVYLGRDPDLNRFVAIKVLRDQLFDEELLERFFREARAAANLRHENIITIYDIGQHDHQPYIALEYVDGETLLDVLRGNTSLPLAQRISYIEQICAGLHYAHAAGIVHRDIKPANVMVDRRGVVRILDFGIARVEGSGMTRDGAMIGTLNYMSPEQMLGRPVDFRSDIFAVGTLAYELITGNKAFPGSLDDGLLHKLPYEQPPAMGTFCPGLPDRLEAIVFRALAKRPEDRFPDLEQMRLALRDVRRDVDPELALETIVVTGPRAGRTSSNGRSEHPEFAERRARQIVLHLEAARAALSRRDIDTAASACEDALTLAPDHAEALGLLGEVERLRQLRADESRARRERERTVRQRVADADLRLSRGDVEGAVVTLDQALTIDPANAAGLALLPRVREAATAAGLLLPTSLAGAAPVLVPGGTAPGNDLEGASSPIAPTMPVAPTVAVPRTPAGDTAAGHVAATPRGRYLLAASAAAIALLAGGAAWLSGGGDDPSAPEEPAIVQTSAAPVADAPEPPAVSELPEPAAQPASTSPPAAAAAPPPAEAPAATPERADPAAAAAAAIGRQLDDVTAVYRRGELAAAIDRIEPLVDTSNDPRVRELATTLAQAAGRTMTAAAASADVLRSSERAPETYAAASAARARAERALAQGQYVDAGRAAIVATQGFRQALSEAKLAAARPPAAPAGRQPESESAAGAPPVADGAPAPSPGGSGAAPATARAGETASASPPATAPPAAPPFDEAGVLALLVKYQDAYREVSVDRLKDIFPSMLREDEQTLRKQFRNFRECQVQFLNPELLPSRNDPGAAMVTARTNYTCQPRTNQPPVSYSLDNIFQVRKLGESWLIHSTGSLDEGAR